MRRKRGVGATPRMAGNTWKTQASNVPHSNGMPEPIWDIHFINSTQGLAAAEFGVILRTNGRRHHLGATRTATYFPTD